jgi:hypothetical protein
MHAARAQQHAGNDLVTQGVKIMSAVAVVVRLLARAALSWIVVALAAPTADPLVVSVGWLLVIAVVLVAPPSRRVAVRWIATGRLKRSSR